MFAKFEFDRKFLMTLSIDLFKLIFLVCFLVFNIPKMNLGVFGIFLVTSLSVVMIYCGFVFLGPFIEKRVFGIRKEK
ncbi:hypothetical protein P9F15_29625 [Bacillus cereus]|nr:hypothetical protein [Bacillus cereus]